MYISIYLPTYLPTYLSIYLFCYLSIYMAIDPSIYPDLCNKYPNINDGWTSSRSFHTHKKGNTSFLWPFPSKGAPKRPHRGSLGFGTDCAPSLCSDKETSKACEDREIEGFPPQRSSHVLPWVKFIVLSTIKWLWIMILGDWFLLVNIILHILYYYTVTENCTMGSNGWQKSIPQSARWVHNPLAQSINMSI